MYPVKPSAVFHKKINKYKKAKTARQEIFLGRVLKKSRRTYSMTGTPPMAGRFDRLYPSSGTLVFIFLVPFIMVLSVGLSKKNISGWP
jgi:hypothetical protein